MRTLHALDLSGDHHVHTSLCNHASGKMEEYVQAASNKGLSCITFLEHLECDIIYNHRTWLTPEHFSEYFLKGKQLQKLYADRIAVKLGVEVGYNPSAIQQLREMLSCFPYEHIGLSYHFYFDGSRHLNMVSRSRENINALSAVGVERVLDEYFSGLIQACSELRCDKICHLDAALRHIPGTHFTKNHYEKIENLLKIMQKKGISLEVNTSGIDHRSNPYPSKDILKRAYELNIPLIVGSDAHQPNQVGRHFKQLSGMVC